MLKASGLMSGAGSPYQYIELIRVESLDGLRSDVAGETMRRVASQFRTMADNPIFIVTGNL